MVTRREGGNVRYIDNLRSTACTRPTCAAASSTHNDRWLSCRMSSGRFASALSHTVSMRLREAALPSRRAQTSAFLHVASAFFGSALSVLLGTNAAACHPTNSRCTTKNYHPIETMNNTAWQSWRERCGLRGFRVHDLRHTVGVRLRESDEQPIMTNPRKSPADGRVNPP